VVLLLLLLLLRLLLLRSIAVRTLAERSAVLESAVQGRVTRQEIGPLMQSAIEPFQKRVEITLQQHASVIASTSAQAHNATATAEASRVETQVGTRLLAGGRVSVMVTYACTQARMNERLATLTTAPTTTPSMVVEEVNRAVREAELALEGRLENRWDLQLSKLRERMTVLVHRVHQSKSVLKRGALQERESLAAKERGEDRRGLENKLEATHNAVLQVRLTMLCLWSLQCARLINGMCGYSCVENWLMRHGSGTFQRALLKRQRRRPRRSRHDLTVRSATKWLGWDRAGVLLTCWAIPRSREGRGSRN